MREYYGSDKKKREEAKKKKREEKRLKKLNRKSGSPQEDILQAPPSDIPAESAGS